MTMDSYERAVMEQATVRVRALTRRRYASVYLQCMAVDGADLAEYAFQGFAKIAGTDAEGPAEVVRLADIRRDRSRC